MYLFIYRLCFQREYVDMEISCSSSSRQTINTAGRRRGRWQPPSVKVSASTWCFPLTATSDRPIRNTIAPAVPSLPLFCQLSPRGSSAHRLRPPTLAPPHSSLLLLPSIHQVHLSCFSWCSTEPSGSSWPFGCVTAAHLHRWKKKTVGDPDWTICFSVLLNLVDGMGFDFNRRIRTVLRALNKTIPLIGGFTLMSWRAARTEAPCWYFLLARLTEAC